MRLGRLFCPGTEKINCVEQAIISKTAVLHGFLLTPPMTLPRSLFRRLSMAFSYCVFVYFSGV